MLGIIGNLLVLVAFVSCIIAGVGFFLQARKEDSGDWFRVSKVSWTVMVISTLVASLILIYLIANHQFQYSYVYRYSSNDLPMHYLMSAFWAGQEGSFLLWIVYTGIIGLVVFRYTDREYLAPVMFVIALCQFFLVTMILGIKLGPVPIGSSPFMTTAQQFPDAPVLQTPGFIPSDGQGLNDLLQNYWMMIHPPTLFVGFSTMIVPFAFAVAGLWKKKYTQWVKPALPWALFANLVLMIGIVMGGYWAYVTLSFGGYWAWDPVENSSLVPWLIGVAAIHTMIAQKKSASSQKASIFLNILAFMLVIYSTFLTRSGILGEISVHSFVDLGLYNQLLLWILAIGILGFGLFFYRYRELPKPRKEVEFLSREFMIFTGAMILCGIGAVILLGTSSPIVGRIFRDSPSAVPIEFYDIWTLPLAIFLALFAGIGQLFWWNKMSVEKINQVLLKPMVAAVASTALVLIFTPFVQETIRPIPRPVASTVSEAAMAAGIGTFWDVYGMSLMLVFLVFTSFFALFGNGMVLWRIARGNLKLAGGAVSHIGLALMLFGIITSASFNNPLSGSPENSIPEQDSAERKNFVVTRGQTLPVEHYQVTYHGTEVNSDGYNTYKLTFEDMNSGRSFDVAPVVYKSRQDQWIQHPDIKAYFEKDIYVSVAPSAMYTDGEEQTSEGGEIILSTDESRLLDQDSYRLTFKKFVTELPDIELPDDTQIAIGAEVEIMDLQSNTAETIMPIYVIQSGTEDAHPQTFIPAQSASGISVTFTGMNVSEDGTSGSARFVVGGATVEADGADWVVVSSYEKPFINLLWLGSIILFGGFILSMVRRMGENAKKKK